MLDLAENTRGARCPDEWPGVLVVDSDVAANRLDECGYTHEGSPTDLLAGDLGEPTLHEVEPGSACRREVQVVARTSAEPFDNFGMAVSSVVIEDEVDIEVS